MNPKFQPSPIPEPAFPIVATNNGETQIWPGLTVRDYFAAHAPNPPDDWVALMRTADKNRNPHNDAHKPPLRSTIEIIASYRYEFADAMLKGRAR